MAVVPKVELCDLAVDEGLAVQTETFEPRVVVEVLLNCEQVEESVVVLGAVAQMASQSVEVVCQLLAHD